MCEYWEEDSGMVIPGVTGDHVAVLVGSICARSPIIRFANNVTGKCMTYALHQQYRRWDIEN